MRWWSILTSRVPRRIKLKLFPVKTGIIMPPTFVCLYFHISIPHPWWCSLDSIIAHDLCEEKFKSRLPLNTTVIRIYISSPHWSAVPMGAGPFCSLKGPIHLGQCPSYQSLHECCWIEFLLWLHYFPRHLSVFPEKSTFKLCWRESPCGHCHEVWWLQRGWMRRLPS